MPRQRDYPAEYQRRLERGRELGLSRPQSRGHARASEPKASQVIQQIKIVQPERVAPKRKVSAKAPRQPTQKRQRTLKEPRGRKTKVRITQGNHNKAGKESFREVDASQFDGKTEGRLANVVETVARGNPNAHIIVTVTDKAGKEHVLGSHGGWAASTLAETLSEMTMEDLFDDISGRSGALQGGMSGWSMTVF